MAVKEFVGHPSRAQLDKFWVVLLAFLAPLGTVLLSIESQHQPLVWGAILSLVVIALGRKIPWKGGSMVILRLSDAGLEVRGIKGARMVSWPELRSWYLEDAESMEESADHARMFRWPLRHRRLRDAQAGERYEIPSLVIELKNPNGSQPTDPPTASIRIPRVCFDGRVQDALDTITQMASERYAVTGRPETGFWIL